MLRLCEAHELYSASAYIYNRLGDYRRPLLDMLAAVAGCGGNEAAAAGNGSASGGGGGSGAGGGGGGGAAAAPHGVATDAEADKRRRTTGYKLLVYLRCVTCWLEA